MTTGARQLAGSDTFDSFGSEAPQEAPNSGAGTKVAFAALRWLAVPRRWRAAVSVAVGIGLWQLFVTIMHPSSLVVVGPWTVLQDGRALAADGLLWTDLRVSMEEFGLGFAIALVIGIAAGVRLGTGKRFSEFLNPWVTIL